MTMHHDFPGGTARVAWTGQTNQVGQTHTVEAMFYLDALPAASAYLWHAEPASGFGRFLGVNSAGNIVIGIADNAASLSQYRTVEAIALGRWYHVVATFSATGLATPTNNALYIKGGGFTFTTSTAGATENPGSTTYSVGNRASDGARPTDGRIRRVRVWNGVALTSGQANEIFAGTETTIPVPNFAPDVNLLAGVVSGSVTGSVNPCNFGSMPQGHFNVTPPIMSLVASDTSAGSIALWADRALNAVVSQGTPANQPTNVTDLTGREAVRFHEAYAGGGLSDRFMGVAGNGATAPVIDRQNVTFLMIGRVRSLGEAQCVFASSGDNTIFGVAATGTSIGTVSHGSWNTGTLRAQSGTHVMALTSNAGTGIAYVNNESASVTSPAAGTANGGSIGRTGAGTNNLEAHVYELHIFHGPLSAADIEQWRQYAIATYGVPANPSTRFVINGSSTPKGWNDWTYLGLGERIVAAFPNVEFYNFSIEGRSFADAVAAGSSDPANREDAVVKAGRRMVLMAGYASNSILSGGVADLATLQSQATAYAAARRTAGYARLIELLPIPRDFGGGVEATHTTRLTTIGAPYFAWSPTAGIWNRVINPALSPNLDTYAWGGDFTNGTYYADSTHLNTTGFAELWSAGGVLGGLGGELSAESDDRVSRVNRVSRVARV